MPYSFTQIEKDKSNRIGFVFSFLIVFYFAVALGLCWIFKAYFALKMSRYDQAYPPSFYLSGYEMLFILAIAAVAGVIHWIISTNNIVEKMLRILQAQPLNPKDTYHATFQNILEELSVATGGIQMEGVVISTSAMNAFALADFNGRRVIGVTEALLAHLNRAQIETVVGHEAAHIISGDCLETTITASLFDLYKDIMSTAQEGLENTSSRRGDFVVILGLGYVFLQVTYFVSSVFKMFISREREYRADAIAVRLTRDPLSLAQALYTISRRWRGYGIPGDGLDAIFIVSPEFRQIEEEEGLFPDFLSTHPPMNKRLAVLLDMAHTDMKHLEEGFKRQIDLKGPAPDPKPATPSKPLNLSTVNPKTAVEGQWEVYNNGRWIGPYGPAQLSSPGWIETDAFIRKVGDSGITRIFESPEIKAYNMFGQTNISSLTCPICTVHLSEETYKGAPIWRCLNCAGVLLYEVDVQKILARDDYYFSDEVRKEGDLIIHRQNKAQIKSIDLKTANLWFCPRCPLPKHHMLRNYYTLAYPVEIDRCLTCQSIWFDRRELEILQYLIDTNKYKSDA